MTAFDQPLNIGRPRGQAPQTPRQGIQVTPNAPGLVPTPAVSQQASQLRQIIDTINGVGQIARTVGGMAESEIRRREFEQARHDRIYEAVAISDARIRVSKIQQDIDQGELIVPEGMEADEFAAELVRVSLPEDAPDAYARRYQSYLVPEITDRLIRRQSAEIERAQTESIALLAEGAYSLAGTPEEAMELVREAMEVNPNLSPREAKAAVLMPGLQTAIEQGDRASFDVFAKALGPDFANAVNRSRVKLETVIRQNNQQAQTEAMNNATNMVNSLLMMPEPQYDLIREIIQNQELPATDKAVLQSRVNNFRQEQIAVERSERRELAESIMDSVETPDQLRAQLTANAELLGLNEREIDQEVTVYANAELELAANNGDLERINQLAATLGDTPDSELMVENARQIATNTIRSRRHEALVTGLQGGSVDPAVARQQMIEDAQRAEENPDAPDVLTPAQRDDILRRTQQVEQRNLSLERVASVLSGDGRTVITRQDDEAIDLLLGNRTEGGYGLINERNEIIEPQALGISVATLSRITPNTREVILANLFDAQPDQQRQAMIAVATIARSRPGLLSELVGENDPRGAAIQQIAIMADRGLTDVSPDIAQARLQQMIQGMPDTLIDQTTVGRMLTDDKVDIDKEVGRVITSAAEMQPWFNPGLGIPFNQADLMDGDGFVQDYARARFMEQYQYSRSVAGRNKEDSIEIARRFTQQMVVRNIDFVRFNGEMHPVLVDNGQIRMREDMRWGEGYEKSITQFITDSGYEKDDVLTVRPTFGPIPMDEGAPREGWLLMDLNDDPLTDEQGNILVWEPPLALRDKAKQTRDMLEKRAAEFEEQREQGPLPAGPGILMPDERNPNQAGPMRAPPL